MSHIVADYLDEEAFLPACAQGAIGIETRDGDDVTQSIIAPLHNAGTAAAVRVNALF